LFAYGVESGVTKYPRIPIIIRRKINHKEIIANLLRLNRFNASFESDDEL
jgi:hypothetical protein